MRGAMTRIVVIDRIEGGIAVLIPDDDGQALHVSTTELPAGTGEGDCLRMEERGGMMMFQRAPDESERRRRQIRSKLDRLRSQ
jgi:hypothetical protein